MFVCILFFISIFLNNSTRHHHRQHRRKLLRSTALSLSLSPFTLLFDSSFLFLLLYICFRVHACICVCVRVTYASFSPIVLCIFSHFPCPPSPRLRTFTIILGVESRQTGRGAKAGEAITDRNQREESVFPTRGGFSTLDGEGYSVVYFL